MEKLNDFGTVVMTDRDKTKKHFCAQCFHRVMKEDTYCFSCGNYLPNHTSASWQELIWVINPAGKE